MKKDWQTIYLQYPQAIPKILGTMGVVLDALPHYDQLALTLQQSINAAIDKIHKLNKAYFKYLNTDDNFDIQHAQTLLDRLHLVIEHLSPPVFQFLATHTSLAWIAHSTWKERYALDQDPDRIVSYPCPPNFEKLLALHGDVHHALKTFETFFNFIKEMNECIATVQKCPLDLKKASEQMRLLETQYPLSFLSYCPEYRTLRDAVFLEMMQPAQVTTKLVFSNKDPKPIAALLIKMQPKKADRLASCLANRTFDPKSLANIYYEGIQTTEAIDFAELLNQFSLSVLSKGNSRNYLVTHKQSGKTWVLKLENHLNNIRRAEHLLQSSPMQSRLVPIYGEKQVFYKDSSQQEQVRTLQLIDYYPQGDLEHFFSEQNRLDRTLTDKPSLHLRPDLFYRLRVFCNIYRQMADILSMMEQVTYQGDSCLFSDAKNSNWLLHEGKIYIADTKSFCFPNQLEGELLRTRKYIFPECGQASISVSKAHAWLLATNMQLYFKQFYKLPSTNLEVLREKEILKSLIESLLSGHSTVKDASTTLSQLLFDNLIYGIDEMRCGHKDNGMQQFVTQQKHQFATSMQSYTMDAMHDFLDKLEKVHSRLHSSKDPALLGVMQYWNRLQHEGRSKADVVAQAVANIPLHVRPALSRHLHNEAGKKLQQALAAYSSFGFFRPSITDKTGELIPARKAKVSLILGVKL